MDDKIIHSFLMIFFAITSQFRSLKEDLPELTKDMNMHDLQTGLTHKILDSLILNSLDQLAELERRSVALEEDLRRTITEISTSQRGMSRWLRHVSILHRGLKRLQEELRAAIETLGGRYRRRIFFRKMSMLESQVREINRSRSRSCPNIPSEGLFDDFEFPFLTKWSSLNRTIELKDHLKDILKELYNDVESLKLSRIRIMKKLERTWQIDSHQQLKPGPGHRGQNNSTLPSSQAAGKEVRSEFQPSTSDSSRARETARNATSHHSDQSGQHQTAQRDTTQPNITIHTAAIQAAPSQTGDVWTAEATGDWGAEESWESVDGDQGLSKAELSKKKREEKRKELERKEREKRSKEWEEKWKELEGRRKELERKELERKELEERRKELERKEREKRKEWEEKWKELEGRRKELERKELEERRKYWEERGKYLEECRKYWEERGKYLEERRNELERNELERNELERKELERKELERSRKERELRRKELEKKELERKEREERRRDLEDGRKEL